MPQLKRTVTIEGSQSAKRPKTTAALTSDVAQLKRQVNSNKPEVRQQTYTIQLTPLRSTPVAILQPTNIAGDEIRLHRVTVGWSCPDDGALSPNEFPFGMLYSPHQGYSEIEGLPNSTAVHTVQNILAFPDATKTRVWQRQFSDIRTIGYRDSSSTPGSSGGMLMDKKFSIPMKVGMETSNEETPTVSRNQIYLVTSQVPETGAPRPLFVTIWYTDA